MKHGCGKCGARIGKYTKGCKQCVRRREMVKLREKRREEQPLEDRARTVWSFLRRRPGVIHPLDALEAIIWPSDELIKKFKEPRVYAPDRRGVCAGCGCDWSDCSDGCSTCRERHYRAKKEKRMVT